MDEGGRIGIQSDSNWKGLNPDRWLEGGASGLGAKEWEQPPKARKCKETGFSSEPPEKNEVLPIIGLA